MMGKPELIGYDASDAVVDLHNYLPYANAPRGAYPGGDYELMEDPEYPILTIKS